MGVLSFTIWQLYAKYQTVSRLCGPQGRLGSHGDKKTLLPVTGIDVQPKGLLLYCLERVNKRIMNELTML